jgi:serine/threonine protein kinase
LVQKENNLEDFSYFMDQKDFLNYFKLFTQYFIFKKHNTLKYTITYKNETLDKFHSDTIKRYCYQLLTGIDYLHSNKIIHRDIKPANIFINRENLVIGDLGHAKKMQSSVSQFCASTPFGSKPYFSPELINDRTASVIYTNKIDIWCFGCVLFEMIKLKRLFNETSEIKLIKKISEYNVDEDLIIGSIDKLFQNLLKK